MDKITAALMRTERDQRIHYLRAAGLTHQAIADEIGCSRQTITKVLNPVIVEREREYRKVNAERLKAQYAEYVAANLERTREQQRTWRRANVERKAEYDRTYRAENLERITNSQAEFRLKNLDRARERDCRYRRENREAILERKRQQWAANTEDLNARRRAAYGEPQRERLRQYRRANIEAHRAVGARRKARGAHGMDSIDRLLSVEYRRAIAADPCAYCGGSGEHDDHKTPLARGGTDHWWNLHRTCRSCNQRKHTMTHEEFISSGRTAAMPA